MRILQIIILLNSAISEIQLSLALRVMKLFPSFPRKPVGVPVEMLAVVINVISVLWTIARRQVGSDNSWMFMDLNILTSPLETNTMIKIQPE